MFKIAQAAVNQSRRPARGAAANVTLVQQKHLEPTQRRIARDTGAINAGADHDYVKLLFEDVVC